MAPQEGKSQGQIRKPRRSDSHDTIVISISSDSGDSQSALLKKKQKRWDPQPRESRLDLNLLPEEDPQSEVGENSLRVSSFCARPLLEAARSEWGRSTARFNGKDNWLQMPASFEELEDTASSKLLTDTDAAAADRHERLDLNILPEEVSQFHLNVLPEVVPQSEVGENSLRMPPCFSDGFDPEWLFCPVSDLAAVHSGVAAAGATRDQRPVDSRHTVGTDSSSDSENSDLASSDNSSDSGDSGMTSSDSSSDSEDSDLASSDSSSDSGNSDMVSSDRSSDSGDSDMASSDVIRPDLNILPEVVPQNFRFDLNIPEVVPQSEVRENSLRSYQEAGLSHRDSCLC